MIDDTIKELNDLFQREGAAGIASLVKEHGSILNYALSKEINNDNDWSLLSEWFSKNTPSLILQRTPTSEAASKVIQTLNALLKKEGKEKLTALWKKYGSLPALAQSMGLNDEKDIQAVVYWFSRHKIPNPNPKPKLNPTSKAASKVIQTLNALLKKEGKEKLTALWKKYGSVPALAKSMGLNDQKDIKVINNWFIRHKIPNPNPNPNHNPNPNPTSESASKVIQTLNTLLRNEGEEKLMALWKEHDSVPALAKSMGLNDKKDIQAIKTWFIRHKIPNPNPTSESASKVIQTLNTLLRNEGEEKLMALWKEHGSVRALAKSMGLNDKKDIQAVVYWFSYHKIPNPKKKTINNNFIKKELEEVKKEEAEYKVKVEDLTGQISIKKEEDIFSSSSLLGKRSFDIFCPQEVGAKEKFTKKAETGEPNVVKKVKLENIGTNSYYPPMNKQYVAENTFFRPYFMGNNLYNFHQLNNQTNNLANNYNQLPYWNQSTFPKAENNSLPNHATFFIQTQQSCNPNTFFHSNNKEVLSQNFLCLDKLNDFKSNQS